ncbi:MAG: hypothetical protein H7A45_13330 [Verrucomicrobiales bacterium]|nr:hypothetical protein [Verrucomicrobiales bacterium]MCP5528318.1 hypothetical protein [Verrucomicrobiales bacterium]
MPQGRSPNGCPEGKLASTLALGLCGILLFSALAKAGWLLTAPHREWSRPDPIVNGLTTGAISSLAVGVELLVVIWILWRASTRSASLALLWLAVVFAWYHASAWWLGGPEGCPCLGGFWQASPVWLILEKVLVGAFLAGAAALFLLARKQLPGKPSGAA